MKHITYYSKEVGIIPRRISELSKIALDVLNDVFVTEMERSMGLVPRSDVVLKIEAATRNKREAALFNELMIAFLIDSGASILQGTNVHLAKYEEGL